MSRSEFGTKIHDFLSNFDPKSISETDFIFCHRFSLQSLPKWVPKCFIGTGANDLGAPLATLSQVLGLKDTSPVPQEAHVDLILTPIEPHFLPLQAVLTSLREQFC